MKNATHALCTCRNTLARESTRSANYARAAVSQGRDVFRCESVRLSSDRGREERLFVAVVFRDIVDVLRFVRRLHERLQLSKYSKHPARIHDGDEGINSNLFIVLRTSTNRVPTGKPDFR